MQSLVHRQVASCISLAPQCVGTATLTVRLAHALLEERDCTIPRQLGRGLLVARRRVVVETVLRSRIGVLLIGYVMGLQGRLVSRPHRVDALVVLSVVDHQ